MTHALYVAAAYGFSALGIAGIVGWIMIDQAARRRDLTELEKRGVRRRSDPGSGSPA